MCSNLAGPGAGSWPLLQSGASVGVYWGKGLPLPGTSSDVGRAGAQAESVLADFADEEDEELKQFTDKVQKGDKTKGGSKIHKVATQKWKGSSGSVVKRLQKELIQIQGTGSFEVELVNDNIFEWYVTLEGAQGSFYEGEKFKLRRPPVPARAPKALPPVRPAPSFLRAYGRVAGCNPARGRTSQLLTLQGPGQVQV